MLFIHPFKNLLMVVLTLVLLCAATAVEAKRGQDDRADAILTAAEKTFTAMKNENYPLIWSLLTAQSRKGIIQDVVSESKRIGQTISPEALADDFATGGPQAKAYWTSFLAAFNPVLILEESKWSMGKIRAREAEVFVLYRKAEKPALLKLYLEDGAWKFGMQESFTTRSLKPF